MPVHLEIKVQPIALKGKTITNRNVQCIAFEYDASMNQVAIYETFEDWASRIPSYWFVEVVSITYWNDEGGVN